MKPETIAIKKQKNLLKLIYFPVFLLIYSTAYPQVAIRQDSLAAFPQKIKILSPVKLLLSYPGTPPLSPSGLIPSSMKEPDRTLIFLDSLKSRASGTLFTRKLYDFVIIKADPASNKDFTSPSTINYIEYSGRKIRNIKIKRLNVFGTDIYSPDLSDPNKLEKFLNNTHINTNEIIVKKNILFSEGDTISPLILSDNERLLRELPFIDDARIIVVPASETEADILVLTKDIYSIGAKIHLGMDRGSVALFDGNIFGMGHEFGIEMPYDNKFRDSPGFGIHYTINNFRRTFIDMNLYYTDGLGKRSYGFDLNRKFVSSATKYAGGISVRQMYTTDDLDSLARPAEVKYNLQDYWISRSFLLNKESVSRLIFGARFTNNNVFDHPFILPESYHHLQRYKMFLGSVTFSVQKFYKASLIYGYGKTEDIPHGGLINFTAGTELNEFKERTYMGTTVSIGESIKSLGYIYGSAGIATFINDGITEQGMLMLRTNFISNLLYLGRYRIRNFMNVDYTRGFDRYSDEKLAFHYEDGFSGMRNDSLSGAQRLSVSIESVLFSPVNFYGFRFALFGFADLGFLFGTNENVGRGDSLSAIGLGIRIRNDNLILNTLQIRLGFFPNLPEYSSANHLLISGEQLLGPDNFDPGPPSVVPYR